MFHFRAIFVLSSFSNRFKPTFGNRKSPLHLRSDGGKPPEHRPHGGILTNNIMAIIKGTFGTNLRKRVGQVVYRNRGGVNIASARPASVKNPRTSAQMKQRMIFTTVQSAYKKMHEIVDHSQEGVTYGAKTMASFMKMNLMDLRKGYASGAFCMKGNSNSIAPYRFKIATGSLIFDQKITNIAGNVVTTGFSIGMKTLEQLTYAELLASLGIAKGDQLTFIEVAGNYKNIIDDNGYKQFSQSAFKPIRVVFSLTADDSTLAFTDDKLNDAIIDQENSSYFYHDLTWGTVAEHAEDPANLTFEDAAWGTFVNGSGWFLYGAAIILSRLTNSVWQRSDTNLFVRNIPEQTWSPAENVLESYNPASNYYLNNATV